LICRSRAVIDQTSEEIFDDIPDFHRQAKAAFLKLNYTSQLIREPRSRRKPFEQGRLPDTSAARPRHGRVEPSDRPLLQDPSRSALEIGVGTARRGLYRLVYKLLPNDPNEFACCAAQMFLLKATASSSGAPMPWKTGRNEFHLKPPAAKQLIAQVLDTYRDKHGGPPKELFIHGRTTFNDEEWEAFKSAVPKETTLVGVRIKTTYGETKLFRNGDYPVLRGTAIILDSRNAYFWTTGYLPQLDTYIGPETPNPLFISVLRTSNEMPPLEDVLNDIMGLTKINYNACNFNDGLPVTVRFAIKSVMCFRWEARRAQRSSP